jgi:DnaJ-domain-containing protein 1
MSPRLKQLQALNRLVTERLTRADHEPSTSRRWRIAEVSRTSHPGSRRGGRCRVSERGRDLYALLGVAPDADAREVARAYRRRLREVHPDTRDRLSDGPDPAHADLRALQEAYAVLRDPARRARYDTQRRSVQKPAEAPPMGIAVPVRVHRPPPARDWLIRVGPVRSEPPGSQ